MKSITSGMRMLLLTSWALFVLSSCESGVVNTEGSFKVWGNCEMCKRTIENTADLKGVHEADWDKESKMILVKFDSTLTSVGQIQKSIASAGYDTDLFNADDQAYNSLDECCQYTRKNK